MRVLEELELKKLDRYNFLLEQFINEGNLEELRNEYSFKGHLANSNSTYDILCHAKIFNIQNKKSN